MNKIFHISKGYKKATIWLAIKEQRICVVSIVPDKDQKTRRERYEAIADGLKDEGITPPKYEEKEAV